MVAKAFRVDAAADSIVLTRGVPTTWLSPLTLSPDFSPDFVRKVVQTYV